MCSFAIGAAGELWKGRGRQYDGAEEALRAVARAASGADHAVCTGDLTQLGHPEEFAAARGALGALAGDTGRFTAFPGNHDRYPWRGAPSRLFEEHFPEHARSDLPGPLRVRVLGEAALIVLDSAGPLCGPIHDRFVHGADPIVICAGSSTQRGHEGYLELEVGGGRVLSATPRTLSGQKNNFFSGWRG